MKQVLQYARTGEIAVLDVPAPKAAPGGVVVRIAASLVSAGTERASSEFARKGLLQKAKARPDLVREVLNKVRRDGILSAASAVQSRLDQPSALGYSSAGTVVEVGEGISDIHVGDRVACAGAGHAVHAEFAYVPRLLVAKFLEGRDISFEEAAFTTVGAVALHGIRTAGVNLGDTVAVLGLGLLGQLTVQALKAAGCRVLGMDISSARAALAAQMGADAVASSEAEFRDLGLRHTQGYGVDSVLITAETPSSGPVNLAAEVARDRAVITAVGTVGMELERKLYYGKELDFRISRSYGPGRYDEAYEQKGRDYPIGYVRWTETRNMEAFLALLGERKLDLRPLITHRFAVQEAARAYDVITGKTPGPSLGVLITYPGLTEVSRRLMLEPKLAANSRADNLVSVGVLGAGSFAVSTLLPAMRRTAGVQFAGICANQGSHAHHAARKFGFQYCATEETQVLADSGVNTVVIATRHHLHARQVIAALQAGKHVFCEKPLCLGEEELAAIVRAHQSADSSLKLMVGFNRRFAPMVVRMKSFLRELQGPVVLHYRINAGPLPPGHWTLDAEQGGGRILGEVCHFIDLLSFLCGAAPVEVETRPLSSGQEDESVAIALRFKDGSQGTVSYLVNGDRAFSKERIEAIGSGAAAVLEDFRRLELVRHGRKQTVRSYLRQDKGHRAEWAEFARSIQSGGAAPIPFPEIVTSTLATLRAMDSRRSGTPTPVDPAPLLNHRY
ncbi:MAG: Gfo/Idh/MocA family oxidoreductase [Acidobacteria bacterium]|nr:Gfo/Idh/MocA family oxidoreductase [Acidobacteriota bacterium]